MTLSPFSLLSMSSLLVLESRTKILSLILRAASHSDLMLTGDGSPARTEQENQWHSVSVFAESRLLYQLTHQTSNRHPQSQFRKFLLTESWVQNPRAVLRGAFCLKKWVLLVTLSCATAFPGMSLFWTKIVLYGVGILCGLLPGRGSCWKMGPAGVGGSVTGSLQGSSAALFSAACSETATVSYIPNVTIQHWPLPD